MTSKIPQIAANFQTQLAAVLSIGATTGTLESVTTKDGGTLVAGIYTMVFDLGSSNEEHLKFTLDPVTKAMSDIKSVTRLGVETAGCVFKHRVGTPGFLTDFTSILKIKQILDGDETLDSAGPLVYDAEPVINDRKQLATYGVVQDAITGANGTASNTTAGTIKTTQNQGAKPRVQNTLVREQNTPDKTLLVSEIKMAFNEDIISFAGGNSPGFVSPGLAGDQAFALNPSNGENITITVDGTACVFTAVTSIGATPGNFLIGASAAITRANFAALINAPGTTNANQVAFTGAQLTAIQKLNATDDLALNAFVKVIDSTVTTFTVTETLAGAGNTWTYNTTKNRIDLLVLETSTNTLKIRRGTEALSPAIPTPTTGDMTIAQVYLPTTMTVIKDVTDATNAYILGWYVPALYRTDIVDTAQLNTAISTSKQEAFVAGEDMASINSPFFLSSGGLAQRYSTLQPTLGPTDASTIIAAATNITNRKGQTFTTGKIAKGINRIRLAFANATTGVQTAVYRMEIYALNVGGFPTGAALGTSVDTTVTVTSNSETYGDFAFATPIDLAPNTQYAFTYYALSGSATNVRGWGSGSNSYSGGTSISESSSVWSNISNNDLSFWVHADVISPVAGRAYLSDVYADGEASHVDGVASTTVVAGATAYGWLVGKATVPTLGAMSNTVAETTDQNYSAGSTTTVPLYASNQNTEMVFKTGNVANLTKLEFYAQKAGTGAGAVQVLVKDFETGAFVGSGVIADGVITTSAGFFGITFSSPLKVKPNHLYKFELWVTTGDGTNRYDITYRNGGAARYEFGHARIGTTWTASAALHFKTYYTEQYIYGPGDLVYLGSAELTITPTEGSVVGKVTDATGVWLGGDRDEVQGAYWTYPSPMMGTITAAEPMSFPVPAWCRKMVIRVQQTSTSTLNKEITLTRKDRTTNSTVNTTGASPDANASFSWDVANKKLVPTYAAGLPTAVIIQFYR